MATSSAGRQGGMQALLSDILRRLRRLETPPLVNVGQYRLYQDPAGDLVVQHVPTGTVQIVMGVPVADPGEPDS